MGNNTYFLLVYLFIFKSRFVYKKNDYQNRDLTAV